MKKLLTLLLFSVVSTYAQKADEKVTFTAKIANRNSDSIVIRSGRNFTKTIKINNKGEFQDSFDVATGLYQFFDGSESTTLFLKNGYNLKLTMDAKEFDESIVYSGKGSKENNFLAQKALSDENFEKELEDLLQKDEATFKSALAPRCKFPVHFFCDSLEVESILGESLIINTKPILRKKCSFSPKNM